MPGIPLEILGLDSTGAFVLVCDLIDTCLKEKHNFQTEKHICHYAISGLRVIYTVRISCHWFSGIVMILVHDKITHFHSHFWLNAIISFCAKLV
jgi:hypothetical protein